MKRYAWFVLGVIALTVALVPLLWGLVRDVLLAEFLRFAWVVDRLVDSLPQAPFWIAFLVIAALVAAISMLPRPRRPDLSSEPAHRPEGQVAELALLIRRAGRRRYFRRRLIQHLSHLGREVIAHEHGTGWSESARAPVSAGAGTLAALGGPHATGDPPHPNASLQQALAQLGAEPTTPRGVVDPAVELFVEFLEEQLEVDHAVFNRSRR